MLTRPKTSNIRTNSNEYINNNNYYYYYYYYYNVIYFLCRYEGLSKEFVETQKQYKFIIDEINVFNDCYKPMYYRKADINLLVTTRNIYFLKM